MKNTQQVMVTAQTAHNARTEEFFSEFARLKQNKTELDKYYADCNTRDLNRALLFEIFHGNVEEITRLFEEYKAKIDIYAPASTLKHTILHLLCVKSKLLSEKVIKNLPIDARQLKPDEVGNTPLHYAIVDGQLPLIRKLLEKNPNLITAKNSKGYTPLDFAAINSVDLFQKIFAMCMPSNKKEQASFAYIIPDEILQQAQRYQRLVSPPQEKTPISNGWPRHNFYYKRLEAINAIQKKTADSWQYEAYQAATASVSTSSSVSWWQSTSQTMQGILTGPKLKHTDALQKQSQKFIQDAGLREHNTRFKAQKPAVTREAQALQQHSKSLTLQDFDQLLAALPTAQVLDFLTKPTDKEVELFNPRMMNVVLNELLARVQHQPAGLVAEESVDNLFAQINKLFINKVASLQQLCALVIKILATGLSSNDIEAPRLLTDVLQALQQKSQQMQQQLLSTPRNRILIRQLNTFIGMVNEFGTRITGKSQLLDSLLNSKVEQNEIKESKRPLKSALVIEEKKEEEILKPGESKINIDTIIDKTPLVFTQQVSLLLNAQEKNLSWFKDDKSKGRELLERAAKMGDTLSFNRLRYGWTHAIMHEKNLTEKDREVYIKQAQRCIQQLAIKHNLWQQNEDIFDLVYKNTPHIDLKQKYADIKDSAGQLKFIGNYFKRRSVKLPSGKRMIVIDSVENNSFVEKFCNLISDNIGKDIIFYSTEIMQKMKRRLKEQSNTHLNDFNVFFMKLLKTKLQDPKLENIAYCEQLIDFFKTKPEHAKLYAQLEKILHKHKMVKPIKIDKTKQETKDSEVKDILIPSSTESVKITQQHAQYVPLNTFLVQQINTARYPGGATLFLLRIRADSSLSDSAKAMLLDFLLLHQAVKEEDVQRVGFTLPRLTNNIECQHETAVFLINLLSSSKTHLLREPESILNRAYRLAHGLQGIQKLAAFDKIKSAIQLEKREAKEDSTQSFSSTHSVDAFFAAFDKAEKLFEQLVVASESEEAKAAEKKAEENAKEIGEWIENATLKNWHEQIASIIKVDERLSDIAVWSKSQPSVSLTHEQAQKILIFFHRLYDRDFSQKNDNYCRLYRHAFPENTRSLREEFYEAFSKIAIASVTDSKLESKNELAPSIVDPAVQGYKKYIVQRKIWPAINSALNNKLFILPPEEQRKLLQNLIKVKLDGLEPGYRKIAKESEHSIAELFGFLQKEKTKLTAEDLKHLAIYCLPSSRQEINGPFLDKLQKILEASGLTEEDIEIVLTPVRSSGLTRFIKARVDAMTLTQDTDSKEERDEKHSLPPQGDSKEDETLTLLQEQKTQLTEKDCALVVSSYVRLLPKKAYKIEQWLNDLPSTLNGIVPQMQINFILLQIHSSLLAELIRAKVQILLSPKVQSENSEDMGLNVLIKGWQAKLNAQDSRQVSNYCVQILQQRGVTADNLLQLELALKTALPKECAATIMNQVYSSVLAKLLKEKVPAALAEDKKEDAKAQQSMKKSTFSFWTKKTVSPQSSAEHKSSDDKEHGIIAVLHAKKAKLLGNDANEIAALCAPFLQKTPNPAEQKNEVHLRFKLAKLGGHLCDCAMDAVTPPTSSAASVAETSGKPKLPPLPRGGYDPKLLPTPVVRDAVDENDALAFGKLVPSPSQENPNPGPT